MRKNFFAAVVVGGEVFTAAEGVDVYAMDARTTTVVIPRNPLLKFCMARLGRAYRITNDGGIKYYH